MKRYLILLLALGLVFSLYATKAGTAPRRDPAVPLAPLLVYPADGDSVMNGQALEWALAPGSEYAGIFDVYIDGILVSENQMSSQYSLSGLSLGIHTWYVVAVNQAGASPPSETRSFVVISGVAIGNGSGSYMLPIHPSSNYSYTQSIFLQSEINVDSMGNQSSPRLIESIAYYWNGMAAGTYSNDWTVYMGHTDRGVFADSTDWMPTSQMMQVYDGHLELPAVPGWIVIDLEYPFIYNNIDNLVIAVHEHTPGSESSGQYFHSTYIPRQFRSITHYPGYGINPDSPLQGYLITAIPNILIRFGELPSAPILAVSPAAIDFGTIRNGETPEPRRVMVANTGIGIIELTAANVSITGPQAAEFNVDLSNLPISLGSSQAVYLPVSVTGISTGGISATLNISSAGQSCDVALTAEVLPPGTIIIGDDVITRRQPFGTQYGYECSAALYTSEQIGTTGLLDTLAWDCASTSDVYLPYRIWLKNTEASSLAYVPWQVMVSDMTLVKTDVHAPNTLGWQSFSLPTPFEYTGFNLVVAVETYCGGAGVPGNHTYRHSVGGRYNHLTWYQNDVPPTGNGQYLNTLPNIKLHFTTDVENDIAALSLTGTQHPIVGEAANYTLRIKNNGNIPQNNYLLKLLDQDNSELAVMNGPAIESLQTLDVAIPWTPTTTGSYAIRGNVQLDGDEHPANNFTDPLQVYVHPEATQAVLIGAGDELDNIPMFFNHNNSIYQCIYLDDELGFESGTISSMAIYNRFYNDVGDKATKIYLGSTSLDNLSAGFVPASELTLVFDGNVEYPAGQNTIFIPFQTPYLHTPGNLIIMFHRPMDDDTYIRNNYFKCQTLGTNRSRYSYSNTTAFDPFNPPPGSVCDKLPQATFFHTVNAVEHDLAALAISGDSITTLGNAATCTIRIKNYGSQTQSNYTVKLLGQDDEVLASVAGPAIDSLQTLEVTLAWTPTTTGLFSIYGKVEMNGDQFEINNYTARHKLWVYPAGTSGLTVGDGSQDAPIPVIMRYRHSLYQTLYYAAEMQGLVGQIAGLQFNNNFRSELNDITISIWMGSTTQADLADGWIPADQLTQVFAGQVDFPSGEGIVNILFDQPFLYLDGGNVVMMVYKSAAEPYTGWANFKCQTEGSDRSREYTASYTPINPFAPPATATLSGQYPQTTFMVIPGELGQVSGTVTGTNNQPLCDAIVSVNDGLFTATTNAAGEYQLPHILILPGPYTISFNAYGYFEHVQSFELEAGEQLVIDANLQALPQVNLSGTVVTNDTGAGIPNALIMLGGYGSHQANTDALGSFTISNIYGHQSYDYSISAPGYDSVSGTVSVADTDHDMGSIALDEVPYAPLDVSAVLNDYVVELTWQPPDPDADRAEKALTGYMVYRLLPSQEEFEVLWTTLTPVAIATPTFSDSSWIMLNNGNYRWAVKAVYTGEAISPPSFSNILFHDVQTGRVAGMVKDKNNAAIAGATITNGTFSTSTNTMGAYVLTLPVGTHTVTASARGYLSQSVEGVVVNHDQHVILQFVLAKDTATDDPFIPVTATALNPNYPNPFNPETTISYSVKEPGRVRLEVFNIKGQKVKTLVDEDRATGHYKLVFNAKDTRGRNLSSGVYLLRMSAPGYQKTSKMIFMK